MTNALRSYVERECSTVGGWLARTDAEIFRAVLLAQNDKSLSGSAAEIGVHLGKSFTALCLGLIEGEKAYCIDVFDDQHLNKDASGHGNRAIFEQNLARFKIPQSKLVIDSRSSELVTAADITKAVGPIRFFSVDGGHWLEIVKNDLRLAEGCLAEHGVIALDDFHRPEWPDVSAGYFEWRQTREKPIVPFAVGFNKLYLCHEKWSGFYKKLLIEDSFLQPFLTKYAVFQGVEVPVFQQYILPEFSWKTRINAYLRVFNPDLYRQLRKTFRSAK